MSPHCSFNVDGDSWWRLDHIWWLLPLGQAWEPTEGHCSQLRALLLWNVQQPRALCSYQFTLKCALSALVSLSCVLWSEQKSGVQWTGRNAPIVLLVRTFLDLHITHNLHCFDSPCYGDTKLTNHFAFYSHPCITHKIHEFTINSIYKFTLLRPLWYSVSYQHMSLVHRTTRGCNTSLCILKWPNYYL